jgi:hypothetical protein
MPLKRVADLSALHLQYRFDQPGTHEVQLTLRNFPGQSPFVSPWIKIEILPADASASNGWRTKSITRLPMQRIFSAISCRAFSRTPITTRFELCARICTIPTGWCASTRCTPSLIGRKAGWFPKFGFGFAGRVRAMRRWIFYSTRRRSPTRTLMNWPSFPCRISNRPGEGFAGEFRSLQAIDHDVRVDPENVNEYVSALGQAHARTIWCWI